MDKKLIKSNRFFMNTKLVVEHQFSLSNEKVPILLNSGITIDFCLAENYSTRLPAGQQLILDIIKVQTN